MELGNHKVLDFLDAPGRVVRDLLQARAGAGPELVLGFRKELANARS
jgi:hypothetical protein